MILHRKNNQRSLSRDVDAFLLCVIIGIQISTTVRLAQHKVLVVIITNS